MQRGTKFGRDSFGGEDAGARERESVQQEENYDDKGEPREGFIGSGKPGEEKENQLGKVTMAVLSW